MMREVLPLNKWWVGVRKKIGKSDEIIVTLTYLNDVVFLAFGKSQVLYQVVVGYGCVGTFNDVKIGDDLRALEDGFEIDFNDADDEFLILAGNDYVCGIGFATNYRSSLVKAPKQLVRHVSIHDWELA